MNKRKKPLVPTKAKKQSKKPKIRRISQGRSVGDMKLFDTKDAKAWEEEYKRVLTVKYQKNTRSFKEMTMCKPYDAKKEAPIFLIPRERTKSYLDFKIDPTLRLDKENIHICPISKGFAMQSVSSFSLGPFPGQALCLVNLAFSKQVLERHIEGGGRVDLSRVNFWKPGKKTKYIISCVDMSRNEMYVNYKKVNLQSWLMEHKMEWFPEWDKWRKHVALCSEGSFHWGKGLGELVTYFHEGKCLDFVTWKMECYIKPSYQLLPSTKEFQFLKSLWQEKNIALGLVHPKARNNTDNNTLRPITREEISNMFRCPFTMCCQPYVVAGCLMDVPVSF